MDMVWATMYANLIRNTAITGKTIEDVPANLRDKVAELLESTSEPV